MFCFADEVMFGFDNEVMLLFSDKVMCEGSGHVGGDDDVGIRAVDVKGSIGI